MEMTTPMQSKPLVNATCKLGKNGCYEDGRCHYIGNCVSKIETNADHIRSMDDSNLAIFLTQTAIQGCPYPTMDCEANCKNCIQKWLQQPCEEGTV